MIRWDTIVDVGFATGIQLHAKYGYKTTESGGLPSLLTPRGILVRTRFHSAGEFYLFAFP